VEKIMKTRHQRGYIFRKGSAWYVRYYDFRPCGGQLLRRQCCRKLADCNSRYRTKSDVKPLAEDFLRPINESGALPQLVTQIGEFVENTYLPWAREALRPSSYAGYQRIWRAYLSSRVKEIPLRDFRPVDTANILRSVWQEKQLGRSSLRHVKAFLSGVFTHARSLGLYAGANPVRNILLPMRAAAGAETVATAPEEALAMMKALSGKARAAVALIYFTGLRPGEARGAQWQDYEQGELKITRSIFGTHVSPPKTRSSMAPVPIIEPLRLILEELRRADGDPRSGPILRGPSGKPLNLANLARREIIPALAEKSIPWSGWYSLRRGIATLVATLERDALAAKGLLRHANANTTLAHYIKRVPEITIRAMQKVEDLCNQYATGKKAGTG
jgi:integrase